MSAILVTAILVKSAKVFALATGALAIMGVMAYFDSTS